jgi:hypothetical protein
VSYLYSPLSQDANTGLAEVIFLFPLFHMFFSRFQDADTGSAEAHPKSRQCGRMVEKSATLVYGEQQCQC